MAELSKRLQAVADMVTPGLRLADVGTDHGYIPIYLVSAGIIPSAVAMDINEGPLERAQSHIHAEGLETVITARLSDGLKNLANDEADSMIAAGMGGGLIIRILSEGGGDAKGIKEYILQPQSEVPKVREYLCANGCRITAENMVLEDGKYYPIMKAVKGASDSYSEAELAYGKLLLAESHSVLKKFLERELAINRRIAARLEANGSGRQDYSRTVERKREILHKIESMSAVLDKYF